MMKLLQKVQHHFFLRRMSMHARKFGFMGDALIVFLGLTGGGGVCCCHVLAIHKILVSTVHSCPIAIIFFPRFRFWYIKQLRPMFLWLIWAGADVDVIPTRDAPIRHWPIIGRPIIGA